MTGLDLIEIRDAVVGDEAFIFASWLRGLYYGDSWFSNIEKDHFMFNYHKVIESLLSQATIKIACLKEDKNIIIGYAVYREDILDWAFVKKDWRKIGIAKALVPDNIKVATHATKVGLELMKKKKFEFKPFSI